MARVRRSGTRVPVEGKPSRAPKTLRLVDEANYRDFHRRWRAIDRLWNPLNVGPEDWDVIAGLRASAREELRAEFRATPNVGPGVFAIAV